MLHFIYSIALMIFAVIIVPISYSNEISSVNSQTEQPQATNAIDKHTRYDYLPGSEVFAFKAGDQASEVLIRPWLGQKQLGTATIIATTGVGADSAGIHAYIRRELPLNGWATLAFTPPNMAPQMNFTTQPEEIEKAGDGLTHIGANKNTPNYSDKQWQDIREKQLSFISSSMAQLDNFTQPYPGKRLLITSGQGAGLIINLLAKKRVSSPDMLVILNPYLLQEDENAQLSHQLAQLTLPILDIQTPDGHPNSLVTTNKRHQLASMTTSLHYQQRQLALNLNNPSGWQDCLNTIKGFALRINKAYP